MISQPATLGWGYHNQTLHCYAPALFVEIRTSVSTWPADGLSLLQPQLWRGTHNTHKPCSGSGSTGNCWFIVITPPQIVFHVVSFHGAISLWPQSASSRQYFQWISPALRRPAYTPPVANPHRTKGFSDPGKQTWSRGTWHTTRGSMVSFVTRLTQHIRECSLSLS